MRRRQFMRAVLALAVASTTVVVAASTPGGAVESGCVIDGTVATWSDVGADEYFVRKDGNWFATVQGTSVEIDDPAASWLVRDRVDGVRDRICEIGGAVESGCVIDGTVATWSDVGADEYFVRKDGNWFATVQGTSVEIDDPAASWLVRDRVDGVRDRMCEIGHATPEPPPDVVGLPPGIGVEQPVDDGENRASHRHAGVGFDPDPQGSQVQLGARGHFCQGELADLHPDSPGVQRDGGTTTFTGTPGRDVILGTDGIDIIDGGGGDDLICGLGGADTIDAGDGHDLVYGGSGADTITAGRGNDRVYGESGNDVIAGGNNNDYLHGGGGHDKLNGGRGWDELRGRKGSDELIGGPGNDLLVGHTGTDTFLPGSGSDRCDDPDATTNYGGCEDTNAPVPPAPEPPPPPVLPEVFTDGECGGATVTTTASAAALLTAAVTGEPVEIVGTSGPDVILGTAGADRIRALSGNDIVCGLGGDDLIDVGAGHDRAYGGNGDDEIVAASGENQLHGEAGDDVLFGGSDDDYLLGGAGADIMRGNASDDTLRGGDGGDRLEGGAGADFLGGDADNDTLVAGDGDDIVQGGAGGDVLDGGDGHDDLYGESGADTYRPGFGTDSCWDDQALRTGPITTASAQTTCEFNFGQGHDAVNQNAISCRTGGGAVSVRISNNQDAKFVYRVAAVGGPDGAVMPGAARNRSIPAQQGALITLYGLFDGDYELVMSRAQPGGAAVEFRSTTLAVRCGKNPPPSFCQRLDGTPTSIADLSVRSYLPQALAGYGFDLDSVEREVDLFRNRWEVTSVVTQSIFDEEALDERPIIDEYHVIFRPGPRFDSQAEREALLISMAQDMDALLGARFTWQGEWFTWQGDFKLQSQTPSVGDVIDIDVTLGPYNAPVVITHMEPGCFGVKTIELNRLDLLNNDEHVLHGDRRWGFEDLGDGRVIFYTRGISIPTVTEPPGFTQASEKAFWSSWSSGLASYLSQRGATVLEVRNLQTRSSETPGDLWDDALTPAARSLIQQAQITAHAREVDRLESLIAIETSLSRLNKLRDQLPEHQAELEWWQGR